MTDTVTVGRIVKPHGLRGEVVVDLLSDVPDRLAAGVEVFIDQRPCVVATSRPHQGRLLVGFDHVTDREAAEGLRGRTIEAIAIDLDEFDTYFVHELVGLPVRSEGRHLGQVVAVIELPQAAAYDLLEVRTDGGRTWLLPAVDDYVEIIDVHGVLTVSVVDPPDGLLDDALHDLPASARAHDDRDGSVDERANEQAYGADRDSKAQ